MAAITATSMAGPGARVVSRLTLGSSDTFTFNPAKKPVLLLDNVTAGALTPNIDGDGGSTVDASGLGLGSVNVSSGTTLSSIAAGAMVAIPLKTIRGYLQGTITITGGSGIKASILEQ